MDLKGFDFNSMPMSHLKGLSQYGLDQVNVHRFEGHWYQPRSFRVRSRDVILFPRLLCDMSQSHQVMA